MAFYHDPALGLSSPLTLHAVVFSKDLRITGCSILFSVEARSQESVKNRADLQEYFSSNYKTLAQTFVVFGGGDSRVAGKSRKAEATGMVQILRLTVCPPDKWLSLSVL